MTRALIDIQDLSLNGVGAELGFCKDLPEIIGTLVQQGDGERTDGAVEWTLKLKVEKVGDGVRCSIKHSVSRKPPFIGSGVFGHLARVGDEVHLRIMPAPDQMVLPFAGDGDGDDTDQPQH